MDKKKYVVAIDVGSSEVVIAVGSIADSGAINIETIVAEPCEGMKAGLVDNSQMVTDSLRRARERAEQQAGIIITDADVSISGKFVRCARYTDHVFVEDKEACISQRDVNALCERMRSVKSADGETIMDYYPITYKGTSGVEMKNPVGCYSPQLSSTYNFILCEHMAKERLVRVFMGAGIKIRNFYAGATIIGESVVNSDEREDGVAVVDIGSGVTDVAVYYGGVLRYIATIPMGGAVVNSDIRAYAGTIPPKTVETLKRRYGSAMVELTPDERIDIHSGSRAIKPIQRLNLATVIEARMSEIAEYVWAEIRESGYAKKLAAGIVLTGGGASLDHIADLFQKITSQEVRVSCAEMGIATEALDWVSSPNLTMAISLLLRGAKTGACPIRELQTAAPSKGIAVSPAVEQGPSVVTPSVQEEPQTPSNDNWSEESEPMEDDSKIKVDDIEDLEEESEERKSHGIFGRLKTSLTKFIDGAFKPEDGDEDVDDDF
ncbi:MAG: cell division protein FtsA [Alistipes sp.]|nr:cell division protein FtsA [Alistipes sp.]